MGLRGYDWVSFGCEMSRQLSEAEASGYPDSGIHGTQG